MLAEANPTKIYKKKNPKSFSENRSVAKKDSEIVDFSNIISDVIENDYD